MSEWQPIETAPKGSDVFLLYQPEHKRPAPWSTHVIHKYPETIEIGWRDRDGNWQMPDHQCGGYEDAYPTHWMPLPEPPK